LKKYHQNEELSVIMPANTVVEPNAVVVELQHTPVAGLAVLYLVSHSNIANNA